MRTSPCLLRGSFLLAFASSLALVACNGGGTNSTDLFDETLAQGGTPATGGAGGTGGKGGAGGATTGTGGTGAGTGTISGEVDTPDNPTLIDAGGVSITQISLYQGVKTVLMEGGLPGDGSIPVVAGRDAMMRVWVALDGNYNGKPVIGRLRIQGVDGAIQVIGGVNGTPIENDLGSTFNFPIPGDKIKPGFSYRVELLQLEFDTKNPSAAAHYPGKGYAATNAVSVGEMLKVVLVPIRYGGDGSNRLPDTSEATVQGYKDWIYGMYPAPKVEVTVREPVDFKQEVSPFGGGWENLLGYVGQVRQQDNAAFDVYYYGIFAPAQSMGQFCGGGCVAGLGNLGGPGDAYSRAAIGLGFPDGAQMAWETAVHEIGHTHGRQHSPCGGAAGADPNYPHPNAATGVWGYDLVTQKLFDPAAFKDVMSYCYPIWVSDFTYVGFLERIKAVNMANIVIPPEMMNLTYDRAWVDGEGEMHWLPSLKMERPPMGEPVDLDVEAEGGAYLVSGHFYPYDHLPGGVFVWPQAGAPSSSVTIEWKGAVRTLLAQ